MLLSVFHVLICELYVFFDVCGEFLVLFCFLDLVHLYIILVVFLLLNFKHSLYILHTSVLSDMCFPDIFCLSEA